MHPKLVERPRALDELLARRKAHGVPSNEGSLHISYELPRDPDGQLTIVDPDSGRTMHYVSENGYRFCVDCCRRREANQPVPTGLKGYVLLSRETLCDAVYEPHREDTSECDCCGRVLTPPFEWEAIAENEAARGA